MPISSTQAMESLYLQLPCSLMLALLLLFLLQPQLKASPPPDLDPGVLKADGCGQLDYPFGFRNSSLPMRGFEIDCNEKEGKLSLTLPSGGYQTTLRILNISVLEGYVRVNLTAFGFGTCGHRAPLGGYPSYSLKGTPYTFSHTRNKFTVIGCDAVALLDGEDGSGYLSGCSSICDTLKNNEDGFCSGVGCCQASILKPFRNFGVVFRSSSGIRSTINRSICEIKSFRKDNNQSTNSTFIRCIAVPKCNEVFLVEQNSSNFSFASSTNLDGNTVRPVIFDWTIGTETCEQAKKNASGYACKENSYCYEPLLPLGGMGYRCNCTQGYAGNPYIKGGCTDLDECSHEDLYTCVWRCKNNPGGFNCLCPPGKSGDGRREGSGCKRDALLDIGLGVGLSLLVVAMTAGIWMYGGLRKRERAKLKQKYFKQNGGLLLQRYISSKEFWARMFCVEELEAATDNFHDDKVVGRGGYGTVYRAVLSDGQVVAIKKSKLVDDTQIEHFINEVVILSKINHRNVVKLLGCCLETPIPLLIYEFISNGTLFHHLHERCSSNASPAAAFMSWATRLRIAAETAAALAYLHCKASIPVIHRDVKSANILLDEEYTAKVSDFGASRLIPLNQTHVTTLVQGTLGYLDPEYFHTSQLTEKSDVYSFGVVLLELLTSEKPISLCRSETERYLVAHFYTALVEHQLLDLIDPRLVEEAGAMQLLAIAQVAKGCLSLKGEERPTMKEVAVELNALSRLMKHHTGQRQQDNGGERSSRALATQPTDYCSVESRLLP